MTLQPNASGQLSSSNRFGLNAEAAWPLPSVLGAEQLRQHRDLAWGAFHWFNSGTYPGAHLQDRQAPVYGLNDQRDLSGGWYDGRDYGHYAIPAAWSVALPLLTWMIRPQALPERIQPLHRYRQQRPALLDLLRPQLAFLLALQRGDGAVHHKLSSADAAPVSEAPQADQRVRWLMPVSSAATANVCAALHLAARAFAGSALAQDQHFAEQCHSAALQAGEFLQQHPESIQPQRHYDGRPFGRAYFDADERDNRLWADVAQHWNDAQPLADRHYCRLWELAGLANFGDSQPGWQSLNFLALFNYLAMPQQDRSLRDALLTRMEKTLQQHHDCAVAGLSEGHNAERATRATQLLWLHQLTGRRRWYDLAAQRSGWFFGDNPQARTWTTRADEDGVQQPNFAPLVSGALPAAPGLLVSADDQQGKITAGNLTVGIDWQASWACYLSLLVAGPRG